ncbi:hypothetical protein JOF48_002026 [Arthrobacter stackebrandtii]|uniref:Uncharacterized protein n=1 Tax=Arthrobacter stackebrandtii TaxID=272161 RepID=A0ABS4YWR7_9MICC|nr:hypothetical protein [Arthrobacter stackebrandtii]MBP2413227.1 hypothetical protein [Arthrobacter stackebrandtii]
MIGYLLAAQKMAGSLESLRGWLVHNNATVMSVPRGPAAGFGRMGA